MGTRGCHDCKGGDWFVPDCVREVIGGGSGAGSEDV